jgi:UDPglucose--hexose-1-phosphate uridylyltransferase
MGRIVFETIESDVRFLNPMKEFAEDVQTLQIRKDPLLGDTSVFNPELKDKAEIFFGKCDQDLIDNLVEETAKTCFFCGEAVAKSTPRFMPDFSSEGRIKVGEALLFPNLFSLGTYHPVIRLCDAHFLKLSEFTPELIFNGFFAAQKFNCIAYEKDPTVAYAAVTANYLFPAGASLVHPHLQMIATPIPYSYQARILDACSKWLSTNGTSYFVDLIEEEKGGQRYVGQTGGWHWLTPFSPLGNNEVMAIHEDIDDLNDLSEDDINNLSSGISRVLSHYEMLGHLSYNYALYSVRNEQGDGSSRALLKIITRQNLYPNYRNDDYFLQKLLQSELIITPPEELAELLQESFKV